MSEVQGTKRLILHFDVNKTLVVSDPAMGIDTAQMINSMLAECSWGMVEPGPQGQLGLESWRLMSTQPSSEAPVIGEATTVELLTYNEYLENVLKPDRIVKKRAKVKFTEAGEVGEALRPWYKQMLEALQIPPEVKAAAQKVHQLSDGRYFILPSFFRLVQTLEEQGRDFAVVIRTFGIDIPNVVEEFNLFAAGDHPVFKPTRPELTRHRRIELPRDSGAIYHTAPSLDGLHMACVGQHDLVTVVHGMEAVYQQLMAKLGAEKGRSMVIQDDYDWWANHGESDDSGKILVLDRSAPDVQHIFLDDNIERDRAHIVDARDLRTGAALDYMRETKGIYLMRVEPVQAILDEQYYVKLVAAAEEAYAERYPGGQCSGDNDGGCDVR